MNELVRMAAVQLVALYRTRTVSPVEVTRALLDHLEEVNGKVNAIVAVATDEAMRAAEEAERQYAKDEAGKLAGVPLSVKDTIVTQGTRTTYGSLLYEFYVPDADAVVVERSRQAGGIVFGKTNTPEFGWKGETSNRVFGATRNPWDLGRTSGGSSGGAAAAVATGIGPIGLGSDTAGSVRIPAAFCGVVGMKPSFGRIPVAPRRGLETLSHVGIVSRSVRDAALVLDAVAGRDARDRFSLEDASAGFLDRLDKTPGALRIAWSADLGFVSVDPQVRGIAESALACFEEVGWTVEDLGATVADPYEVVHVMLCAALAGQRSNDYEAVRDRLDPGCRELIEEGFRLTGAECGAAMQECGAWAEAWRRLWAPYDLIVTPTVPLPAFEAGADRPNARQGDADTGRVLSWTPFTYPLNISGQPAASVPCGFTDEGLPVGLQIIGRWRDDLSVLHAAACLESRRPWDSVWPSVCEPSNGSRGRGE